MIYIFFGHFLIIINNCIKNLYKKYIYFIFFFLIIAYIIIPFFCYQFYINLALLNIYLYKKGFKLFISQFSDIIKIKSEAIKYFAITITAYHIFIILFFGTFIYTKNLLLKSKNFIYLFITILGFIVDLIILPLHIIINPVILCYVINTNKYDEKEKEKENYNKKYYNYIFNKKKIQE